MLLNTGVKGREDARRPGFYEMEGVTNVYYVFRYPTGPQSAAGCRMGSPERSGCGTSGIRLPRRLD